MFRWDKLTRRCPLLSVCLLFLYINAFSLSDGAQTQSLPSQRVIGEALNTVGSFLQSETGTKWLTKLAQTQLTPLTTDELTQAILQEANLDDKVLQAANTLRVALSTQVLQNGESNATNYLQTAISEGWKDVITDIEKHDDIICLYRKDMTETNVKQSNDWQKWLKTILPDYTVHLALDKDHKYVICLKKIEVPATEATSEASSVTVASENISLQAVVPLLSTTGVDTSETHIKTTATTVEEATTIDSKASIETAASNRKSLQSNLITLTNKLNLDKESNSKVEDIQEDCSDEDDTYSEDDDYVDKVENSKSLDKSRKYLGNNLSNGKRNFPVLSSFSRPQYLTHTGIKFDSMRQPRVPGQLEKFMPVNFSTNQEPSCNQPRIFFTVLPAGCNLEKAINPLLQINEARKRGIPIIINLPVITTGQIQTYALPIFRTKTNVSTFETQMCSKPFPHPPCILNQILSSRASILKPRIPLTQTGIFNSKANVVPISQKSFVQRFLPCTTNKFPSVLKLIKINPTRSMMLPNYISQSQLKQMTPMTNIPILPKSIQLEMLKRNFRSAPLMYTAYKLHSKLPLNIDPRPTTSNFFQNTLTYKPKFSIIPTLAQTQSILPRLTPTWQNYVKKKLTLRPTKQEFVSEREPQVYSLNQSIQQLHPMSLQQLQQQSPLKRQPILFKPIHNIANVRYNLSIQQFPIVPKPVQAISSKPISKLFAPIPIPFATIPSSIIPMEFTPSVSRQTQINPTLSIMPNFPVSKVPLHRPSVLTNSAQQMLNGLGPSNINSIAPCPSSYNKSIKLQINIQGLVREPIKVTILSEPDEHVRITADGPGSIVNPCYGVSSGRKNMGDLDGAELVKNNKTIAKVMEQTTKIQELEDIIDEVVQNQIHYEDVKLTKESIDRHEDTVNFVDKIHDGRENEWLINETTIKPTDNVQVIVVTTEARNNTDTISY